MKYPTLYADTETDEYEATYVIRGPGMTNSKTGHPSNSIDNNVTTAKAIIGSYLKEKGTEGLKVQIMGHSRNGVAAALVTRDMKTAYPGLEIESVIFDPVPGGDANVFNGYVKAELPSAPKKENVNSTVIYSLMDNRWGFNPMHVYGAKRLILTQLLAPRGHRGRLHPSRRSTTRAWGCSPCPPGSSSTRSRTQASRTS
jgi:hypothetical protein